MIAKMKICLDGKTYEILLSNLETGDDLEAYIEKFYENLPQMSQMKIDMQGGHYLVMGKNAIQSAVFLFEIK